MGKTIRQTTVCKKSIEDQMQTIKQRLVVKKEMNQTVEEFLKNFQFPEFKIEKVFPNEGGETQEQYITRNVNNHTTVISEILEFQKLLKETNGGEPPLESFNWCLVALECESLSKDMFSQMTYDEKCVMMFMMLEENEKRLQAFESIVITVNSTKESEITMTTENNMTQDEQKLFDERVKEVTNLTVELMKKEAEMKAFYENQRKAIQAEHDAENEKNKKKIEELQKENMEQKNKNKLTAEGLKNLLDKASKEGEKIIKEGKKEEEEMRKTFQQKDKEQKQEATKAVATTTAKPPMNKYVKAVVITAAAATAIGAGVYLYRKSGMKMGSVSDEQVVGG